MMRPATLLVIAALGLAPALADPRYNPIDASMVRAHAGVALPDGSTITCVGTAPGCVGSGSGQAANTTAAANALAAAQASLQPRNSLGEIAALGSAAQVGARTNIGVQPTSGTVTPGGTTQATASVLPYTLDLVTGGGSGTSAMGVMLGQGAGATQFIADIDAVNYSIYPPIGAQINGQGLNTALTLPGEYGALCGQITANNYYCTLQPLLGFGTPYNLVSNAWAVALTINTLNVIGSAPQATGVYRPGTGRLGFTSGGPASTAEAGEFDANHDFHVFNLSTAGMVFNDATGKVSTSTHNPYLSIPIGSHSNGIAAGTTSYGPYKGGPATVTSVANQSSFPSSVAVTVKTLTVSLTTAPGGTATVATTLYVNGAATALTCTVTGAAVGCNDNTDSATIAAGQSVSWQFVSSSGAATTQAGIGAVETPQ